MSHDRPTFSPVWHRVRNATPRLRPHVQITRQRYRGRRWHVVHDPASNQFYRLNPIAYDFVGTLDGSRSIEQAWKIALTKHGDDAPTQNDVVQLIGQLYSANLLAMDTTPETEQLLKRSKKRRAKKVQQQLVGIMYFRVKLFNPDRLISAIEPVFRPLIGRVGFVMWCALLLVAVWQLLPHFDRLASGVDNAISPSNWGWLIVVFVVTKLIHELGHGIVCKRFGGQVPELGMMMLVLFPAPYVDASSCWAFESKWQRVAVGAAGMIFELAVAAVAALVWLATLPGTLSHQIAYNAMLTASFTTLLFNANPLMRFDGYYILADLLEVPNMAQRANQMLQHLFKKYIYRLPNATPPTTQPGERAILLTYGIAALAYRTFLFITITLFVMGKLFAVGLVLAIWSACAWFLMPVGKFINWHATNPQLGDKRGRSIAISCVMVAVGLIAVGMIPMPDRRRTDAVIEPINDTTVRAAVPGFIAQTPVRVGDYVQQGDVIAVLENNDLLAEIESNRQQRRTIVMRMRTAIDENQPAAAQVHAEHLAALDEKIATLESLAQALTITAPHAGQIVGGDLPTRTGAYVQKGQAVCRIVNPDDVRITATLTQQQADWLGSLHRDEPGYRVQMRSVADTATTIDARVTDIVDIAQRNLPHAALGYAGGGTIDVDTQQQTGTLAKQTLFHVHLQPQAADDHTPELGPPGQRVRVRFTLPPRPLLHQWLDRLSKVIQGRVNV